MRLILILCAVLAAAPALAQPFAGADDPACQAALAYSAERRGVAILVLKDGRPICEGYGAGVTPDQGHEIWSGTKSFSGLMAAAAVQDGLLTLDEPVSRTLPEWRSDPAKATVTIRQLLSLTSGLASDVGRPPSFADAVTMPLSAAPGERFQYGPAPFQVFGALMQRKLKAAGRDPDPLSYLKSRILEPAGVTPSYWRRTPHGDLLMPQGSAFTVRQWAKFGEFVRGGARVDGRPLVDPAAFAQLFKGSSANPSYGVSWWLPHPSAAHDRVSETSDLGAGEGKLPGDLVMAAGAGDQRLYVIPSRHLTIAREARLLGMRDSPKWSDRTFLAFFLGTP